MRRFTILSVFIAATFLVNAQDWRKQKGSGQYKSFYEIQKGFYNDLRQGKISSEDRGYKQFKRWEYIWKDRILEDGSFINPLHTYYEWNKYEATHALKSIDLNDDWTFIGPDGFPDSDAPTYAGLGRVNAIAFHPDDNNTIWVGSPSGGLWKSTDGGQSWSTNTDNLPNLGVSDIVIDPTNPQVMYIVTGDSNGQHNYSLGVMKSTDGGANWNLTGLNYEVHETRKVNRLLMDPDYPEELVASTSSGIYYSEDGAATWMQADGTEGTPFHSILAKTDDFSVIYAGSRMGSIYASTDYGRSFSILTDGLPAEDYGRVELAVTPADPDFIIALHEDGFAFASYDAGATWSEASAPEGIDTQGGYNMCLAISPIDPDLILIGAVHGWRSTDGGESWEKYLNGYWNEGDPYFYVHSDHHVFKFLPGSNNILFSGNDGGLHKGDITSDVAWEDLSSGLQITQFYGLGGTKQVENYLVAGSQDNDAVFWNGNTWKNVNNSSDGIGGLINYSNTNIMYAQSQEGGLTRTLDGYQTPEEWIGPDAPGDFVWPLVMDPIDPNTVYGGWDEIYKTTDNGDTWEPITNGELEGAYWTFIAVSPSDPDNIYAGNAERVFVTDDGGTNWYEKTSNLETQANITGMVVHETDPYIAVMIYGGYIDGEKVYITEDGGDSWTNISWSLPNIPVRCVVFHNGANEDVYIGTDLGVFHIDSDSDDWSMYSSGLPNVIVSDLEIHYATGMIRAATFGRGIWESPVQNESTVSVEDELNLNEELVKVSIHPNPTNGIINLNSVEDIDEILVYNLAGGVVKHLTNLSTKNPVVDITKYSNGLYFFNVKTPKGAVTLKVVKE